MLNLTLRPETVDTLRHATRSHLRELEKTIERCEAHGNRADYWKMSAELCEAALVELEEVSAVTQAVLDAMPEVPDFPGPGWIADNAYGDPS